MTTVLGIYLIVLTIVILFVIQADAVNERCQLFSTRNFFLFGILLFQTVSGALTLLTGETERNSELNDYNFAAIAFCAILTIFVLLFLSLYAQADWLERRAVGRTRIRRLSQSRLVAAGVVLTSLGVISRFAGGSIPYVSVLLPQMAAGCLCAGAALIAMAWARSAWNLFIAAILGLAFATSSAVLLVGAFGRRELVGLVLAIAWALYHEKWRLMPVTRLIPRLVVALVGLTAVFLVFSGSRVGGENVDRSLGQQVERIATIDPRAVQEHLVAALSGQFAGGISMWIFDQRWHNGGYVPLHSLVYFTTMPIPRDFWPGKPEGLGLLVVDEAGVSGVSEGHSWGPGLVGHLSHDVVLLALPFYALILAWTFRYIDARVRWSTSDPLTVVLFGSALGQVLGMPRGDIGLFAFNLVAAFAGVWLFGRLAGRMCMPIDRDAEEEMWTEATLEDGDLEADDEAAHQTPETTSAR